MHAMHVYTDGAVWVVAHSPEEAAVVLLGEEDAEDGEFELVPDGDEFTITDDDPVDDKDGDSPEALARVSDTTAGTCWKHETNQKAVREYLDWR